MTQPDPLTEAVARLRLPFAPNQVGHLPRAGITLEYVGHGAVTSRLLDVDPAWNWEPAATDNGRPVFELDGNGNPVGLWIKLTVAGVTRWGFGSCLSNQFEAEKVLIGDAIRNAAMRFGVALDLWVKGHAEDDERVTAGDTRTRAPRGNAPRQGPPVCPLCQEPALKDVKPYEGGYAHGACIAAEANAVEGHSGPLDNDVAVGTGAAAVQPSQDELIKS